MLGDQPGPSSILIIGGEERPGEFLSQQPLYRRTVSSDRSGSIVHNAEDTRR